MQTTKQTKPAGFPRYAAAKRGLRGTQQKIDGAIRRRLWVRKGTDELNGTNGTREVL